MVCCVVSESPQHLLLQALNDQNQAAIDERLATEGVKVWINHRSLPEQLENPVKQFKDVTGITGLAFASLISCNANVRHLVEAGADFAVTDSRDFLDEIYSALHYACASDVDSDDKVAYLMQRDASSQTGSDGSEQVVLGPEVYSTSLRLAARLNQADRVKALIDDHGASVNDTDRLGRTALHVAARAGHAEVLKVLTWHTNCRINATEYEGRTALHFAVEGGSAEAASVLAQHPDCCVNATDLWELRTALHDAAAAGSAEVIIAIVQHPNCDFSITDRHGLTAAERARRRGHDDTAAAVWVLS